MPSRMAERKDEKGVQATAQTKGTGADDMGTMAASPIRFAARPARQWGTWALHGKFTVATNGGNRLVGQASLSVPGTSRSVAPDQAAACYRRGSGRAYLAHPVAVTRFWPWPQTANSSASGART